MSPECEGIQQNSFSFTEPLLDAIHTQNNDEVERLLQMELSGHRNFQFLDILGTADLIRVLKILGSITNSSGMLRDLPSETPFDIWQREQERILLEKLEKQVTDPSVTQVNFTPHKLGNIRSLSGLRSVSQMLQYGAAHNKVKEKKHTLWHYPGSFNPFPHQGHIEVAEQVLNFCVNTSSRTKVVVSTTRENSQKKELYDTFESRYLNLEKGFAFSPFVTALPIEGTMDDRKKRIAQLITVSQFDREQRMRIVCGSDVFLKRLAEATGGDEYSLFFLSPDVEVAVSVRQPDRGFFEKQCSQLLPHFRKSITVLPPPMTGISGTHVRALGEKGYRYASSVFIE